MCTDPTKSDLVKPDELAARLGTSAAALANWRYLGQGPRFIKIGSGSRGGVRYRASDVEAWLDQQTRQQSGE